MLKRVFLSLVLWLLVIGVNSQDEIEMKAATDTIEISYHPLNEHFGYRQNRLIIQQSSREIAATFEDPSRVLYRHAGISNTNDQTNSISYRGLSPELIRWSINGAEILSPNHLSNAGRLSDLSSASAGGVLAIPFDVVNRLQFFGQPYTGAAVPSLSGNIDFDLNTKGQNFYKIGLLGMEAGYQAKDDSEMKVHARYSTVGLLSDLGVSFDGEEIRFYDLFFSNKITSNLNFTLIAGRSTNEHAAQLDTSQVSFVKDLQDISFASDLLISGLQHKAGKFENSLFASYKKSTRNSSIPNEQIDIDSFFRNNQYSNEENLIAYSGKYKGENSFMNFEMGLQMNLYSGDAMIEQDELSSDEFYYRAYLGANKIVDFKNQSFNFSPEISLSYIDGLKLDPSIFLSYNLLPLSIQFNYASKHRARGYDTFNSIKQELADDSRSMSLSLKLLDINFLNSFLIRAFDIKVNGIDFFFESSLYGDLRLSNNFNNSGTAFLSNVLHTQGLELMADKSWGKDWYVGFNVSLFESENETYNIETPQDFGWIYNISFSKKFITRKRNTWTIHSAFHSRGGAFQYILADFPDNSRSVQLKDYSRLDLRAEYRWKEKNVLTIDIQNLLSIKNEAYYYFDPLKNDYVLESQLELIPIISYKRILN